jgi:hypothetical protein
MTSNIKDFLLKEVKTYKSYKRLSQYKQGILYAYEIALIVLERQERQGQ